MNACEFLERIHGNRKINFRVIKESSIKLNGEYNDYMIDKLLQFNRQGYNVYYVVNGGGDKDHQIDKINAVYIDFDCGRDENKKYYPLDKVNKYKNEKRKVIESFEFEPSFLVETRNGFHVYWLVEDGATVEQFKDCQSRLINYFDSDKAVKNPSRVMRLPNYNWVKDIHNPFMCSVLEENQNKYDIKAIIDHLPSVSTSENKNAKSPSNNSNRCRKSKKSNDGSNEFYRGNHISNIYLLKDMVTPLNQQTIQLSAQDYYEYILTYDLREILELPSTIFNCILPEHEDNSPSAGFIINEENGHMIYHCFGCGASYNNIQLIEKLLKNNSRYKTLKWFERVLNIKKVDSEIIREYKDRIDMIIEFILSGEFFESNPITHSILKRDIEKLIMLLEFAKMNLHSEKYSTEKGNPIFYGSRRKIGKDVFGVNQPLSVNKTIQLFNILGLINKLAPEDLPIDVLEIAKQHAVKGRLTNHYEVPDFYTEYLEQMEDKAKVLKNNNYSKKGLSREYILRTFGEEFTNKYYPQDKHKIRNTKQSDDNTQKIVSFILEGIKDCGFIKFNEVIENADLLDLRKSAVEKQLKISIQEICDSYNLKVIKATTDNKKRYNLPDELHGATKMIVLGDE